MRNPSVIFMGLFVMAMGLYVAETRKSQKKPETPVKTAPAHSIAGIQLIYQTFAEEPYIAGKFDGVALLPEPSTGVQVNREFTLVFQGDDAYSSNEAKVHSDFESALDKVAEVLSKNPALKIEISGYADARDPKEAHRMDSEQSPLAFSFSRAEWVARNLSQKTGIEIQGTMVLRGMGLSQKGKRVEIRFQYE